MATCVTCNNSANEGLNCATCGGEIHKACSKMFNSQRYCKKCSRKAREVYDMARGLY